MPGSLQPRVKVWISKEDVVFSDLNNEFNNVLLAMQPLLMDDYSIDVTQMQTRTDPGEVGSESLATTLAGEIARIRQMLKEISGKNQWYESPVASLAGLANAVGTGLTSNRIVSGRVRTTSLQPVHLIPNGSARTITLDGTPVNFIYYVNGVECTISTDVSLTNLTAATVTNNTCLVNDSLTSGQDWTRFTGENGVEIPVDTMGTDIQALVGKMAAFKLAGAATEYFTAYVASTTSLQRARRGYFFDNTDSPIKRTTYSDNNVITLMKLTWVYAKSDGTLTVTYNQPVWSFDQPSSPALGDYWFDLNANTWNVYGVGSYTSAGATLVGMCIQDGTNTVAARSFEPFKSFTELNTVELFYNSASQLQSRFIGSEINVWGATIKCDYNIHTWDMTIDLESGVTEASNTYYYFYITETGDKIISNIRPTDRREDLLGYYHPHNSWRSVGYAWNDGSSNLGSVVSYYSRNPRELILPSQTALIELEARPTLVPCDTSGGAVTFNLPPMATWRGQTFFFFKTSLADANAITIKAYGAETINGVNTYLVYAPNEGVQITSDGLVGLVTRQIFPNVSCELHLDTGLGHGSTNTKVRRYTNIRNNTLGVYATYADSVTLGMLITIAIPGLYSFNGADAQGAGNENVGITQNNAAALTLALSSVTYANGKRSSAGAAAGLVHNYSCTFRCAVGDLIRLQDDGSLNNATDSSYFRAALMSR